MPSRTRQRERSAADEILDTDSRPRGDGAALRTSTARPHPCRTPDARAVSSDRNRRDVGLCERVLRAASYVPRGRARCRRSRDRANAGGFRHCGRADGGRGGGTSSTVGRTASRSATRSRVCGRGRAAFTALSLYAVSTTALGVTPPRYLDGVGLLLGLAHGLFFPALNVLMLSRVPRSHRGRALALFTTSFHFEVTDTAVLGPVAAMSGYPAVFVAAGAVTALDAWLLSASRLLREPAAEPTLAAPVHSFASAPERVR
jgi:hypothetical protein